MGLQDFRVGRRRVAAELGGISRAAANGSDVGFSLCDALEPTGQPLERSAVYGCDETGEAEAGGAVCAGAGGRRLHGECATGGFAAAGCAIHLCARRRAVGGGTWRAAASDRAAPVCGGEGEVGGGVHAAGPRTSGLLGAQLLSRGWRSGARTAVLGRGGCRSA